MPKKVSKPATNYTYFICIDSLQHVLYMFCSVMYMLCCMHVLRLCIMFLWILIGRSGLAYLFNMFRFIPEYFGHPVHEGKKS